MPIYMLQAKYFPSSSTCFFQWRVFPLLTEGPVDKDKVVWWLKSLGRNRS